jgi:hypothetical protein
MASHRQENLASRTDRETSHLPPEAREQEFRLLILNWTLCNCSTSHRTAKSHQSIITQISLVPELLLVLQLLSWT